MQLKGNKKLMNAWAFYDWANSAYPLVITTAIFPIYFTAVTENGHDNMLTLFGFDFINTALYSYTFSFSFLLVSIISPFLSGIADYTGNKKFFLKMFCYLGATCCALLYFFSPDRLALSLLTMVGASLGFWGSIVFYNAYLPEIAHPKDHDSLSAKGYALGYLGSSILLIANLVFITFPDLLIDVDYHAQELLISDTTLNLELATEMAHASAVGQMTRNSFLSVAIWWVLFAQLTFARLPNNVYNRKPKGNKFLKGFQELKKVWIELKENKILKTYLLSFFIFSMGVQTVIIMATLFAEGEIELGTTELILTILIIQFVAIGGSYLFSFISSKFGNLVTLKIALIIWLASTSSAYFIHQALEFYFLAATVGLVMGGIQSLSRSTYSKLLPETIDHASYFSFYDICEKLGIVLGTFSYGLIIDVTGNMRNSIFALGAFFVLGIVVLYFIPRKTLRPLKAHSA